MQKHMFIDKNTYIAPHLPNRTIEAIRTTFALTAKEAANRLKCSPHTVAAARRYLRAMNLHRKPWTAEVRAEIERPRKEQERRSLDERTGDQMLHYWPTEKMEFCVIHKCQLSRFEKAGWTLDRDYEAAQGTLQLFRKRDVCA
ncbi:MAG: hypothetical protein AAGA36_00330 [Pseudomonadota bacterium]